MAQKLFSFELQVPNLVSIVGFQDLDIALRLILNLGLVHSRGEEDVHELAKLKVLSRDCALSVPARHVSSIGNGVRVGSVLFR